MWQNLPCIKFKRQSLVTVIHRYYCDYLMMSTNIDLKGIEINFEKRFYKLHKCRVTGQSKLVLLSGGSFKTNCNTHYNICKSGNLVDQWSDYCTITSIKSKIYTHNSFSGEAAQPTF